MLYLNDGQGPDRDRPSLLRSGVCFRQKNARKPRHFIDLQDNSSIAARQEKAFCRVIFMLSIALIG